MKTARNFLAATLVILFSATVGYSFDIAIYGDPLSEKNGEFLWRRGNNPGTWNGDSVATIGIVYANHLMDSVYEWYREMGVTKVMVNYPFLYDFNAIPTDSSMRIKVMNWYYPGQGTMHGDKYVNAQYRNILVGLTQSQGSFWSFDESVRNPALRTSFQPPSAENPSPCVAIGPSINGGDGAPDTLWRATSNLGDFSGWDWYTTGWLDSSIYMPMHFRLTWAVDPVGAVTTSTDFADFYWMVQAPNDAETGATRWWQFPYKSLTLDSLPDTTDWITSEFVDSALTGVYHLLDENFAVLDTVPPSDVHFGPANPPHSLDDVYLAGLSYGLATQVRMAVQYRGNHNFYLNRIEVYDEGSYRMFASADSDSFATELAEAFDYEYTHSNGKLCGWYYDEWDAWGEQMKSIVNVNRLLQTHGLPTFYINGFHSYTDRLSYGAPPYPFRNDFMSLINDAGVHMSVQMDEFYPFAGDAGCTPDNAGEWPTEYMLTSTRSDTVYLTIQATGAGDCANSDSGNGDCGCYFRPYTGVQSLQCALDAYFDPNASAAYIHDLDPNLCLRFCPGDFRFTTRVEQVEYVHQHDGKFWMLIQGGADTHDNDPNYRFILRNPTPNEAKLVAWLAVACNADGIMWYPWDFGGLLAWTDDNRTNIEPTERYEAATDVGQKIQRIAPTLEPLEFVKTYASRAFETDYPNAEFEATQLDTLATNTSWFGNPIRTVEAIAAWEPDGTGWSSTPEANPYVQVTRFRNSNVPLYDPSVEDYWFLIVNRRALTDEQRKIRLLIEIDSLHMNYPYRVDYILGDSTGLAGPSCAERTPECALRFVDVILQPGSAELVHFWRGDFGCETTWDQITQLTAHRVNQTKIQLRWESVGGADAYYIYGSPQSDSTYFPIGFATDTTYVDSLFSTLPRYYYMVQACGPGGE